MTQQKSVRWGILGAGRIAHQFAQDLALTPNARLAAIASSSAERAQAFATKFDIDLALDNYEALYQSNQIDAIYIASPHTEHLAQTVAAANAGKAVLCEKPFTTSSAELDALCAQLPGNSFVMEGMWTWFLPAIQKALSWLKAGRIGQLVQIKTDFGYPQVYSPNQREYDASKGGGCLLEMGIYPVALAHLFTGESPRNICARVKRAPNGVEDDFSAVAEYGDVLVTYGSSFRAKLQNWAYIIGTEGYIAIPDFWRAQACYLYELDTRVDHFTDNRQSLGFNFEVEAVSADILAGKTQSDVVPLAASRAFQAHMDLLRECFDAKC